MKLPVAAANGTLTVTEKVQLAPGASVPPVNVNRVSPADPVKLDPTPHCGSGEAGKFAVIPVSAGVNADKSSVNEMLVASVGELPE